jgi:hypothetical protein
MEGPSVEPTVVSAFVETIVEETGKRVREYSEHETKGMRGYGDVSCIT